jgi:ribose transport system substrate-binding protein
LTVLFAACGKEPAAAAGARSASAARVAVIPKGTTHVFWQAVEAGARVGAEATGLDVTFKGPLRENDRGEQIKLVQQFVGEGVAGIALAPLDHRALAPVVKSAKQRGIPVVIFDSALDGTPGEDFASYVATDNENSGALAGQHLAELVAAQKPGGGGKVVLLRYQTGSASTEARELGFLLAVRAAGLEVLVDNREAGATVGEAKTAALNLADELRRADGVFCPNESVTVGMLLALDQLGLTQKLAFVGFDSSPPLVAALRDGKIDALVLQDPRRMGEIAVRHLGALVDGQQVEPVVDTGCVLATTANMEQPDIARLLR